MTSAVQLRRPKNAGSNAPSRGSIGRPRSWTEFNTRFRSFSNPVNIDINPVPMLDDQTVKRREPNSYRKVRPLSASVLDQRDVTLKMSAADSNLSPSSPKYTSFMAPNPWRHNAESKNPPVTSQEQEKSSMRNEQLKHNCDTTSLNYNDKRNAAEWKIVRDDTPEAKIKDKNATRSFAKDDFYAKSTHSRFSSDSDSCDSAVVVSGECTPYATSSEKSPRWRYGSKESGHFDQESGHFDQPRSISGQAEDFKSLSEFAKEDSGDSSTGDIANRIQDESRYNPGDSDTSSASISLPPPQIVISGQEVEEMEFFPDEDVIHFEESPVATFDRRAIVPSPLKSCYAPAATYDDLVEYSDSENSSGDENSISELSRHNANNLHGYEGDQSTGEITPIRKTPARSKQLRVMPLPGDVINDDVRKQQSEVKRSSRRRVTERRQEDDVDLNEILEKFQKSRHEHMTSLRGIYEDSRKKISHVMEKLKETMTENGYREWYPRVR